MDFADGEGFEGATWVPSPPAETGTTRETPIPAGLGDGGDMTAAYPIPAAAAAAPPAGAPPAPASAAPAPGHAPPMPGGEPDDAPPYPGGPQQWGEAAPAGRHRAGRGRKLLWLLGLIVLVALILVGGRLYMDTRYFVGVEQGKVAVFRGLPTKTLGIKMFGAIEVTDIPAAQALACPIWHQALVDGDTASSQQAAEQIVATIRKDLAAGGKCAPTGGTGTGGGTGSGGNGGSTGGTNGGTPGTSPT